MQIEVGAVPVSCPLQWWGRASLHWSRGIPRVKSHNTETVRKKASLASAQLCTNWTNIAKILTLVAPTNQVDFLMSQARSDRLDSVLPHHTKNWVEHLRSNVIGGMYLGLSYNTETVRKKARQASANSNYWSQISTITIAERLCTTTSDKNRFKQYGIAMRSEVYPRYVPHD